MFNLKEIKSIPCKDVAQKHGIQLKEKHGRWWGKLRSREKTASFSINKDNNLWYDFGSGKGGSVIDLIVELEDISSTEAINKLAEEYGFKSERNQGWNPLTDHQYKELGIQPERATMNFDFDLNKHTPEQLEKWSKKYGMPVRELAMKYPDIYNEMIEKVGVNEITELRDSYKIRLEMFKNKSTDRFTKAFLKEIAKQDAETINRKVDLLQRAIINTAVSFAFLKVCFDKDFNLTEQTKDKEFLLKEKLIKTYKDLFNYDKIKYFSLEQIKALDGINKTLSNYNNDFISIDSLNKLYLKLGERLELLDMNYNKLLNNKPENWEHTADKINSERLKVKSLFNKCNTVIEGIKHIKLDEINETIKKQQLQENSLSQLELI